MTTRRLGLILPGPHGLAPYDLGPPADFRAPAATPDRIAFAAAHVVADPLAEADPWPDAAIGWDATLAFRRHLWTLGFAVAGAMDTAQRGMGLGRPQALDLIGRSVADARACGAVVAPFLSHADPVLQDRRGVSGMAERPSKPFHHDRRAGIHPIHPALRQTVPSGRQGRAVGRLLPRRRRHGVFPCRSGGVLMPEMTQLSINFATVRKQWGLIDALEGVARAGIPAVAPWRDQIAAAGLKPAVQRFRDLGLKCSGLCRGGLPDGSLDLADARAQVEDGIATLRDHARKAHMPLAIEPLHPMYVADRACVNIMAQALDICDGLGPGLGVACDVYHVWWDPDLQARITRAGQDRLLAFHICDWLRTTKDLLLDRGMMGDGVIDIPLIRSWVQAQGFTGFHEVEIFSAENWWTKPPADVLETCITRHKTMC